MKFIFYILALLATVYQEELKATTFYLPFPTTQNLVSSNGLPVPIFTSSKTRIILGDTVIFDASQSYDNDGRIMSYKWDFQDGTTDTGKIVVHKFLRDGIFRVKLTVTDNDNNEASVQHTQSVYLTPSRLGTCTVITPTPSVNAKVEGWFLVNANYSNPYNPDEVKVDALITLPDQKVLIVPCFYYIQTDYQANRWKTDSSFQFWGLRFTSPQTGIHKITLQLTDAQGMTSSLETSVMLQASTTNKGIIKTDLENRQYYRRTTGEPYYPMGINNAWNSLDNYTKIINNLSKGGANFMRYWHAGFGQQQLEWKNDGFNKGLGVYSQGAAAMQDSILDMCLSKGINLQMCIYHHGMFSETVNSNWSDNPYNSANGGPLVHAEAFFYDPSAKVQTKKLLRYLIARWGYSSNLFAWELFNEVQFTGSFPNQSTTWRTEVLKWHDEMGKYIKTNDPFNHIVTTSADDNQLVAMNDYAGLDVLEYHTYSDNLLDNIASKDASFLSNLTRKGIICGEYGTNTNANVLFNDQQKAIWTGLTSQVPHIMWQWDNYTDTTWANLFRQPADFTNGEDFTKEGALSKWYFAVTGNNSVFRTSGFSSAKNNFYGYFYDISNQNNLRNVQLTIPNIPRGTYRVKYYLQDSNKIITIDSIGLTPLSNTLVLPIFSKGMAVKIQFLTTKVVSNKDVVINGSKILSYPNPVFNNLTLEFNTADTSKATALIFDIYGRLVQSIALDVLPNENVTVILPLGQWHLTEGIYLVQLTNGNEVFAKKIMFHP